MKKPFKITTLFFALLLVFLNTVGKAQDLTNGLISVWEFDESSGTTLIDSYGNNNGINNGAAINQPGNINQAYLFDGVDDYIQINDNSSLHFGNTFTYAAWIKRTDLENPNNPYYETLLAMGPHMPVLIIAGSGTDDDKIKFYVNSDGEVTKSTITISDTDWHHVVVTKNGSTSANIYIDGIDRTSGFNDITLINNNYISALGVDIIGGTNAPSANTNFDGLFDNVAIWNRALTASEIETLYNSGLGSSYSDWVITSGTIDTSAVGGTSMTFYTNTIPLLSSEVIVKWPVHFSSTNYFLYLRAWTDENVDEKAVQIQNAISDVNKAVLGFSLKVKNPNGYLTYYAVDTAIVTNEKVNTDLTLTGDGTIEDLLKVDTSIIATKADIGNFIFIEEDGSTTNEGSLTVGVGAPTTSLIQSNTAGSASITLEAGPNISLSESGDTIAISAFSSDPVYSLTGSGAITYDVSNGRKATITLSGTPNTITITNLPNGGEGLIEVINPSSYELNIDGTTDYVNENIKGNNSGIATNDTTTIVYWRLGSTLNYGFLLDNN